jgi:thiol-disulfide isomerase/thioredoxin
MSTAAILLAASGLGSEVMFVLSQKYLVGAWCPVCLSIAGCMAVTAICYGVGYFQELTQSLNPFYKGEYMKIGWRGIASLSAFAFGFLFALVGISKTNELQAVQDNITSQLWFGERSSPIEVYFFTDWACPACRKIEPDIEQFLPEVTKDARFMFVDFAVHPETYNYTPFNISFMVYDKKHYIQLRNALSNLSQATGSPTEQQVQEAIQGLGIRYKGLNFADVALATKYFKELGKKFDIDATPTMVIVNTSTRKGKKLEGLKEITTPNILRSINALK